ncbi:MAG: PAS domain S-box protein [Deltaproteobacteria bacterium]|nr:PAS domain S-box protein [Deltaproteobacteria bacterium]
MTSSADSVEQRLRIAIDSSPSGLLMTDSTGRIVLVNREIERLFGYPREALLGQNIEILLPDRLREQHVEWRASFVAAPIERRMGEGRDLFARRKDGSEVPVEVGLTPLVTRDGFFVLSSVVDISARKRAEQRFRVAVESSPSGMLMVDSRGHILLANREVARMFGYSPGELLGQSIEVLVPPALRERHPEERAAFFARPSARAMGAGRELHGIHKNGHEVAVEIGLNPIETDEGILVLGSVVDVTERRRTEAERASLEEQLRQSQKLEALGRLAGGIAHDFNNILSAVVGYAEVLRSDLAAGHDVSRDIEGLLVAAERGREVTSRVLRFSRRQALTLGAIDLVRTVEDAAGLLRAALPASVRIELDLDHPDPAMADAGAVHTILMNLGTNASHAMPEGGTLRVALSPFYARDSFVRANPGLREGAYVRLSVTDSGLGMDEATRSRAFEPFFTTKPIGAGTGLGLATVHGVMRDHGGTVWLESAPGAGTSVHCIFPAVSPVPAIALATSESLAIGRGERVLFVDDEPTLAALGARRLEGLGYDVVAAVGPEAALERLRDEPFALLVTDYTMPGMDGLRLAREARSLQPGLRIVMLSGRVGELDAEALARAGVRRMIEKPVTLERLAQMIREVLDEGEGAVRDLRAPKGQ